MDERFRNILNLALHPSTGEGEAQAALNRARAMVARGDLDQLLGGNNVTVQERVVVRDRVVYSNPKYTHVLEQKYTIPQRWMHSFLERLFGDSPRYDCMVEMISCKGQTSKSDSGMKLEVRIHGSREDIRRFDREIDRWFTVMRGEEPQQTGPSRRPAQEYQPSYSARDDSSRQTENDSSSQPKSWWQRLWS